MVNTMSGHPPKTTQDRTQTKDTHPIPGQKLKFLTPPGIEPGPPGWKAGTLPATPRRWIDNRTHYTRLLSNQRYDTTLIVFLATFICFQISRATTMLFSICAGFASDRIGRVYSTNMADLIFFHKTLTFRTII